MSIENLLRPKSHSGKIDYRHILLCGVLCLFIFALQGQIRPKQLRNEVLKSQAPPKEVKKSRRKASGSGIAQPFTALKPLAPIINPLKMRGVTLIHIDYSDSISFNSFINPDIQIIKGNVLFRHDNTLLYCDSAYYYKNANSLDAFGHVKIVQGDTLFIYSDLLFYDGNLKQARLRRNVRMENRKTVLTTDSLNYDRISNLAYYYTGGKLTDPLNTLTSVWGQYSTASNEAVFVDKVQLTNKNYKLNSDSLRYNTRTHIANLMGPTRILYKDETDIYTTSGWYDTSSERSMLLKRSQIKHKNGKTIVGDTLFYDKKMQYGEGFSHVIMVDSTQKTTLNGNYCYYSEKNKKGMAADSALMIDWSGTDSMFIHADTLFTLKDSIYDAARGYYNVRFFRNDVQGVCDSISYSGRDSVLNMYGRPLVWNENNQLSGEHIQAFTKNKKVNKIHIQQSAIAIQHHDSVYYNQLSGKEIIAFVDSNQLKRINVDGNAETMYYPMDDKDSTIVGQNKTESSFVVMYLKNKRIDRVVLTSVTNGIMSPLPLLAESGLYLKNFIWLEEQRPKTRYELFREFPDRQKASNSGNREKIKPEQPLAPERPKKKAKK